MTAAPRIAVIDYGMGNLRSVAKAVEAAGGDVRIVTRPADAADAAGLVLPGVGALADCVIALESSGLGDLAREWIAADRPFLGVCLGLQALFEFSEEADTRGLGVFPGRVVRVGQILGRKNFRTDEPTERVDTKILETLLELEDGHELPIGLRVQAFVAAPQ